MRSGMEFENRPAKREVKNIGPHRASYQWDRLMQLHKSEELIVSYIHQRKPWIVSGEFLNWTAVGKAQVN